MAALRFVAILGIMSGSLLLVRWTHPHVIDGIAVYVSIGCLALALSTAIIGLLTA